MTMGNKLNQQISQITGSTLQYIELPMELITHTVLHELANKCINLTYLLLGRPDLCEPEDYNQRLTS